MKIHKYVLGGCVLLAAIIWPFSQGQAIAGPAGLRMAGASGVVLTGETAILPSGIGPMTETSAGAQAIVLLDKTVGLQRYGEAGRPSGTRLPVRIFVSNAPELLPGREGTLLIVVETPGYEKYVRDESTFIKNVNVQMCYTDDSVSVSSLPKQRGYTVKPENYGHHSLAPGQEDTSAEGTNGVGLAESVLSTVAEKWLFGASALSKASSEIGQELVNSPVNPEEFLGMQNKYDFLTLRPWYFYRAANEARDTCFTRREYEIPVSIAENPNWDITIMLRDLAIAPIDRPEDAYTLGPAGSQRAVVIHVKPGQERVKQDDVEDVIVNSIGMRLKYIRDGDFWMGSADDERWHDGSESPRHPVKLTKGFYIGLTEVTQAEWVAVMNTRPWLNRRFVMEGDSYPATFVNWNDAVEFCGKLSEKEGRKYRLPTEAEWEYACRAGSETAFSFGDDYRRLDDFSWFVDNAIFAKGTGHRYAHEVAGKKPNTWGLYDMHGNVGEWCSDAYASYSANPAVDPKGPSSGEHRLLRGGSWLSNPEHCRSAGRKWNKPDGRYGDVGFRVVLDLK